MDANNEQVQKIEGEKKALRNQLIVLTVLSFVVSFAFYGITLMQNPFNKSDWAKVKLTCLEDRKDLQREKGAEFWVWVRDLCRTTDHSEKMTSETLGPLC